MSAAEEHHPWTLPCHFHSLSLMNCKSRAEAFARSLHTKLRSLGRQADDDEHGSAPAPPSPPHDENTSLISAPHHGSPRPQSQRGEDELYFDFDISSPESPADQDEPKNRRLVTSQPRGAATASSPPAGTFGCSECSTSKSNPVPSACYCTAFDFGSSCTLEFTNSNLKRLQLDGAAADQESGCISAVSSVLTEQDNDEDGDGFECFRDAEDEPCPWGQLQLDYLVSSPVSPSMGRTLTTIAEALEQPDEAENGEWHPRTLDLGQGRYAEGAGLAPLLEDGDEGDEAAFMINRGAMPAASGPAADGDATPDHAEPGEDSGPTRAEDSGPTGGEDSVPAKAEDSVLSGAEDSVPTGAGDSVPARGEDSVPARAEDGGPARAGDGVPARADDSVPAVAEDSVPARAGDSVPARAEDSVPARDEDSVPARAEDSGLTRAEDGVPAGAGDNVPTRDEDSVPTGAEDGGPTGAGDSVPTRAEDSVSARAEDSVSARAGDSVPARAGDSVPARAGDSGPTRADDSGPTRTEDSGPARTEDSVPTRAEDSVPTGAEDSVPTRAEDSVPTGAEDSVPARAEDSVPAGAEDSVPTRAEDEGRASSRAPGGQLGCNGDACAAPHMVINEPDSSQSDSHQVGASEDGPQNEVSVRVSVQPLVELDSDDHQGSAGDDRCRVPTSALPESNCDDGHEETVCDDRCEVDVLELDRDGTAEWCVAGSAGPGTGQVLLVDLPIANRSNATEVCASRPGGLDAEPGTEEAPDGETVDEEPAAHDVISPPLPRSDEAPDHEDPAGHASPPARLLLEPERLTVNVDLGADEEAPLSPAPDEEEAQRRVRRSSSLKTCKTPPGTPNRKKIVRFADAMGLDLEAVKHVFLDDLPTVPSSAFVDLQDVDQTPEQQPPDFAANYGPALQARNLVPVFPQPASLGDFMERLRRQSVCLESAVLAGDSRLRLVVRVLNLDFHKAVVVAYTTDEWASVRRANADYVAGSHDGFSDKFATVLDAGEVAVGQRLAFAVHYRAAGRDFWDNNYGQNYCFQCFAEQHYQPSPTDDSWVHFL